MFPQKNLRHATRRKRHAQYSQSVSILVPNGLCCGDIGRRGGFIRRCRAIRHRCEKHEDQNPNRRLRLFAGRKIVSSRRRGQVSPGRPRARLHAAKDAGADIKESRLASPAKVFARSGYAAYTFNRIGYGNSDGYEWNDHKPFSWGGCSEQKLPPSGERSGLQIRLVIESLRGEKYVDPGKYWRWVNPEEAWPSWD